ncbi:hypothetical protein BDP55DRAFT_632927 [Colletotrichum godetiae]|uniref:Uncharacterized protein n=1 Tax=Colletotrichum godetiae TaxID=1209918 RepID=A0AAJ0AIE9_9PEZI|nr:uncharacterized protein BDP55DRAFT_632927 [Colletotrichum godetiae]KAK1674479.1 hypothetical protein BDP55DRAFT_632927 [Colletotrichum godetiae]
MRPVVSRYGGIGLASNFDFRYKLVIIDADHSNSVDYAISLVKLSLLLRTEDSTILRIVWSSSAPVDKELGRMLAVSTNKSDIPITIFLLTQPANLPSLSNLRWISYDATDEEFPGAGIEAIAPNYAMIRDLGPSVHRTRRTVFFRDEGSELYRHLLIKRVQVAIHKHMVEEDLAEERGSIRLPDLSGRSSDVAKDAHHLVLLRNETNYVFDKETSAAVESQDAGPNRAQPSSGLCPNESAFAEAIRRLYVLVYICYDEDEVKMHLNKDQTGKIIRPQQITRNDLSVAYFLSCITADTPATVRSAKIEIAAIVLVSQSSDIFVQIISKSFDDEESFNGLFQRHSTHVPNDVIQSGAMWLSLAMLRYYREGWQHPMSIISYEYGNLKLSSTTFCEINLDSEAIAKVLDELVPEANGNAPGATLYLSHGDVGQIQRFMVRAWAHNVALYDGEDGTDSNIIFSGARSSQLGARVWCFLDMRHYSALGFSLFAPRTWDSSRQPSRNKLCSILLSVLEGDEDYWEGRPEDEEYQGDQA